MIKSGSIKSVMLLICIGIIIALVQPIEGQMGPGMMGNQGYNRSYGPGPGMGPGMMGYPGYNYSYNYSYGPGMRGHMMMGNMMAIYYPESKPIAQDEALKNMQSTEKYAKLCHSVWPKRENKGRHVIQQ